MARIKGEKTRHFSRRASIGPLYFRIGYRESGGVYARIFNLVIGIRGVRDVCVYRHAGMRLIGIESMNCRGR